MGIGLLAKVETGWSVNKSDQGLEKIMLETISQWKSLTRTQAPLKWL